MYLPTSDGLAGYLDAVLGHTQDIGVEVWGHTQDIGVEVWGHTQVIGVEVWGHTQDIGVYSCNVMLANTTE